MSRRTEKVASVIQHEVGEFLKHLEFPVLITISKVEVSPDLKWCKIWITVLGNKKSQDEVLNILAENLKDLQRDLNRAMTMKFVPKISFVLDHGQEYAAKINELLRNAKDE
jgi:ribosome-binding factor A